MPDVIEREDGVEEDAPATRAGSEKGPAKNPWDDVRRDAEYDIVVDGQEIRVKGEKLKTLAQLGYRFSDRMAEVNQKEGRLERDYQQKYDPYIKLDDFLTKNPDLKPMMKAVARRDFAAPDAAAAAPESRGAARGRGP